MQVAFSFLIFDGFVEVGTALYLALQQGQAAGSPYWCQVLISVRYYQVSGTIKCQVTFLHFFKYTFFLTLVRDITVCSHLLVRQVW